nr:hypothetical protein [uncultured archaeon]
MAPIIEVSEKVLKGLDDLGIEYSIPQTKPQPQEPSSDFIYVPSIKLYVAKERSHLGKNWFESHEALQENGEEMLSLSEFRKFLKYLVENPTQENAQIYKEITEIRNPWRGEWLDADFKMKDGALHLNAKHKLENGVLKPKYSRPLTKNTLMEDRRISLADYVQSVGERGSTAQGLPSKDIQEGDLYSYFPRSDNNSVAGFNAGSGRRGLDCDVDPSGRYSDVGVRVAKQRE